MLVISLVMTIPEAEATLLDIDGNWHILNSPENLPIDSPYVFVFNGDTSWTLYPTTPVLLTVTDLYVPGDMFEVWINDGVQDKKIDVTTDDTRTGDIFYTENPDEALGSKYFSQAYIVLQPGTYSITFKATQFAITYTDTSIAFKVDPYHVPDGGTTLSLLAVTLAGVAGLRAPRWAGMSNWLRI